MIKILFLCHGNICRSPMAQFVLADKVNKLGRSADFEIESKALSNEEVGNGIHYGTKAIFKKYHIPYREHYASRFTKEDYEYYDHIILMDHSNRYLIDRFIPYDKDHKISMLLKRDIDADRPVYQRMMWILWNIKTITKDYVEFELRNPMDGNNFYIPARQYIPPEFTLVTLG